MNTMYYILLFIKIYTKKRLNILFRKKNKYLQSFESILANTSAIQLYVFCNSLSAQRYYL
jgi:hypothetical protein